MVKEIIQGFIALAIVAGAIYGLFVPSLNAEAAKTLLVLAGGVIGYYFGTKTVPFAGVFSGKK